MNKQELIDKIESLPSHTSITSFRPYVDKKVVLGLISQLDEPEKVTIPQFVADWIEESKQSCKNVVEFFKYKYKNIEMIKWIESEKRFDLIARAWLDGYKVELEPKYIVKLKGICGNYETLNCEKHLKEWLFSSQEENSLYKTKHTRKELEDAGFGEVFNSPLFEVEEVE